MWSTPKDDGRSIGNPVGDCPSWASTGPDYTPHVDTGDYVIVVNADKVQFTGPNGSRRTPTLYDKNGEEKLPVVHRLAQWSAQHSSDQSVGKEATEILHLAVKRMLPKNALATHMLAKLNFLLGGSHSPSPAAASAARSFDAK